MTESKKEMQAKLAEKFIELFWPDYVSTSMFVLAILSVGTDLEIKPLVFLTPLLYNGAFAALALLAMFLGGLKNKGEGKE
jgi:hypothetical protein